MENLYVTMVIRREGKVVLIVTCDQDTRDDGLLFDILEQYMLPDYEVKIKTEEVKDDRIN